MWHRVLKEEDEIALLLWLLGARGLPRPPECMVPPHQQRGLALLHKRPRLAHLRLQLRGPQGDHATFVLRSYCWCTVPPKLFATATQACIDLIRKVLHGMTVNVFQMVVHMKQI